MKMAVIVGGIVLLLGGVLGAALMGVINIPGVTPAKKKSSSAATYKESEELASKSEETKPKPADPAVTPPALRKKKEPEDFDPLAGQKKLAKVWAEMEPASLIGIVDKWKDDDLALQLSVMKAEQVASLLELLKPDRASKLSKLLQDLAAKAAEVTAKA